MCIAESLFEFKPHCVLVVSTGGGGDVTSALVLAGALGRTGVAVVTAVGVWERFVRDPEPGPVPLESLVGVERGEHVARLLRGCYAIRSGRYVLPSACNALRVVDTTVYAVDMWRGSLGIAMALQELAGLHGCDAALVVDVGGDILASGCEKGLWSPLGDSVGLAGVLESGLPAVLAIHGLGADGELSEEELLEKMALVARQKGYRWIRGLDGEDVELLEKLITVVYTEASRMPLLAVKGHYGRLSIRRGTRMVRISLVQAATFFLDAVVAAEYTLAKLVRGTTSLEEARRRLNMAGVYTELDLEEDLRMAGRGDPEAADPVKVREEGRQRLAPCIANRGQLSPEQ
ncbi:DUF1152 domain-containing protein [Hyperthermus butylicus]|uniref:Conserved archaeal protein n=1 Tax=Hyperthermus butylicus (strain DSM 5456 / JCM 9403 / PLM1-5) TaxID=415426 RepID=A2BLQ9_HYPBU|nr:DUF1152 domain-containing protein [Hyperthermus butylicus]ABM80920.1 conserved archaeal protein [Hyperthermus butylicus DSM 5456]